MHYVVHIPTKPYLARYLAARYGDPVRLNNSTLLGVVVLSLLQKKVITHISLQQKNLELKAFSAMLTCMAPWRYMTTYGVDLTDDHIIQINRYFDNEFEENLHHYVQRSIKPEGRYKGYDKALENFIRFYGIELENHITFECLKKIEYRFRKKQESILAKNVPSSSTSGIQKLFE